MCICIYMSHVVDDWQRWRISNLDDLLRLNTLAGRTYHDLTQYPVRYICIHLYVYKNLYQSACGRLAAVAQPDPVPGAIYVYIYIYIYIYI